LVHVPSELIAAYDPVWGDSLLGDKAHSVIFDTTKIKRLVPDFVATTPFAKGAQEIINWFDAEPPRQKINREFDQIIDRILEAYQSAWPQ
jgi:hypothetical protein